NSTGAGGREASEQAVREGDRPQTASSQGKAGAESTWALTQREADLGMLAGSAAVAGLLPGAAQTMQPLVLRTPSWLDRTNGGGGRPLAASGLTPRESLQLRLVRLQQQQINLAQLPTA
ncbi:hypothetical protein HaLaN_28995, partial [Haematococcus lacustris]